MTSYQAVDFFRQQLERNILSSEYKPKVVLTPSSVSDKGVYIQLSVVKTYLQSAPRGVNASRYIKVRVAVRGTAESLTGLKQALACIEDLDDYLSDPLSLRLQDEYARDIPNTRIIQSISEDDSFFDSPDSIEIQDVEDIRMVTITIPTN